MTPEEAANYTNQQSQKIRFEQKIADLEAKIEKLEKQISRMEIRIDAHLGETLDALKILDYFPPPPDIVVAYDGQDPDLQPFRYKHNKPPKPLKP